METEKSTESKDDKADKVNLYTRKVAEMDATIKVLMKQIVENNGRVASIQEYMETYQLSEYDLSKTHNWVRPTAVKLQLTARLEQCW